MRNVIPSGTACFISTIGHNGFWYPILQESAMTKTTKDLKNPKFKTWVCGRDDLIAVEVSVEDIEDLYGNPSQKTIVWVEKKFINKGEKASLANISRN